VLASTSIPLFDDPNPEGDNGPSDDRGCKLPSEASCVVVLTVLTVSLDLKFGVGFNNILPKICRGV
jgi:hypothetical protein